MEFSEPGKTEIQNLRRVFFVFTELNLTGEHVCKTRMDNRKVADIV